MNISEPWYLAWQLPKSYRDPHAIWEIGALAGRWLKRQPEMNVYWRGRRGCGMAVWYVLSSEEHHD